MQNKLSGAIAMVSIIALLSCGKNGGSYATPPAASPGTGTGNAISISNMSFGAATTTVDKGTTITWTNNDAMAHTVTADDNSFTSANMNKGDTYSHTFTTIGTVAYHCKYHSGMTASVTVK